jgi:hypothetical protein
MSLSFCVFSPHFFLSFSFLFITEKYVKSGIFFKVGLTGKARESSKEIEIEEGVRKAEKDRIDGAKHLLWLFSFLLINTSYTMAMNM